MSVQSIDDLEVNIPQIPHIEEYRYCKTYLVEYNITFSCVLISAHTVNPFSSSSDVACVFYFTLVQQSAHFISIWDSLYD